MLGLLGVLGLLIAAVGVYGVMAYLVSQRTREIGVRIALGATRTQVMRMVISQAGALAALGIVLGGIAAWNLTGTVQSFVFGVQPNDVRAFAIAGVTFIYRHTFICHRALNRRSAIEVSFVATEIFQASIAHFDGQHPEAEIPEPAKRPRLDLKQGSYPS